MVKSGQFYGGKIDGIQKRFTSRNIDHLLPPDKLAELTDRTIEGEHTRFFKTDRVLAKTVVTPADNSDGRRGGVVNHTVLYQFDHKVTHEEAQYVFDVEAFVEEILAGKRKFKMPNTPSYPEDKDMAYIDLPPPIMWEVKQ